MNLLLGFVFIMLSAHYYFIYKGNKERNPESRSFRPRKKTEEKWNKYDLVGFSLTLISFAIIVFIIFFAE